MSTLSNPIESSSASSFDRHNYLSGFGSQATWQQTLANALVITRREVRDSFRDWRIITPIFILTLFFPFLANFAGNLFVGLFERYSETPEGLEDAFLPLMPMIVGFFPMSISLVIALETFVGEKERRSLEPLLSTPLTNVELYIGKVLAATLPPLLASYFGVGFYLSVAIFGRLQWRPDPMLIFLIMVLTTIQGIVMVTAAVVISSQTTSTRAANLLASVVILPMSLLVIAESLIMIQPRVRFALWYVALGLLIVIVLLVRMGARIFNREELLGSSVDHINLRYIRSIIVEQFTGFSREEYRAMKASGTLPRPNVLRWYRRAILPTLGQLRQSMLVILVGSTIAYLIGFGVVMSLESRIDLGEVDTSDEAILNELDGVWGDIEDPLAWIRFVVEQNARVLFVASFFGIISFGVLAVCLVVIPFGILGGLSAFILIADMNPLIVIFGVLPHGIAEIPAIIIAGAAALRAGSIVTKPPSPMTVGEAWLRAIADSAKLGIAVVLPLLVIGGILEVTVTPRVIEWMLAW